MTETNNLKLKKLEFAKELSEQITEQNLNWNMIDNLIGIKDITNTIIITTPTASITSALQIGKLTIITFQFNSVSGWANLFNTTVAPRTYVPVSLFKSGSADLNTDITGNLTPTGELTVHTSKSSSYNTQAQVIYFAK